MKKGRKSDLNHEYQRKDCGVTGEDVEDEGDDASILVKVKTAVHVYMYMYICIVCILFLQYYGFLLFVLTGK